MGAIRVSFPHFSPFKMNESNWNSATAIEVIEKALYAYAEKQFKKAPIWKSIHDESNTPLFVIRILPSDGPLKFWLEAGNIVQLYVQGLNMFGGTGRMDTKEFWKIFADMLYLVPRMVHNSILDMPKVLISNSETVRRAKRTAFQLDSAEIIPLIPRKNIRIKSATMSIEAKDLETGIGITFEMNAIPIPYPDDVVNEARIRLTQYLFELNHEEEENEPST